MKKNPAVETSAIRRDREWQLERELILPVQKERVQRQKERALWNNQLAKMNQKLLDALIKVNRRADKGQRRHCDLHGPGNHDNSQCHHQRRTNDPIPVPEETPHPFPKQFSHPTLPK
jgi:hypothetical protein